MHDAEWQRVSPVSIIFLILSTGVQFIKQQGMSAGPGLVAAAFIFDNKAQTIGAGIVLIAGFIIIRAILYYLNFRFQVLEDQIIVRKGILNKENINLHFDRIQNVNVSTPFYFIPFELVNCQLDSAGSKGSEIVISGTTASVAQDINQRVLAHQSLASLPTVENEAASQASKPGAPEIPLLTISSLEAAKAGFINGRVWFLAAMFGALFGQIEDRLEFDVGDLAATALDFLPYAGPLATVLFFNFVFLVVCGLFLAASSVTSVVRNYGFELHEEHDRLRRVAGLTERHQTALRKEKIQGVSVQQNLRARALGRVTLRFHQTAGHAGSDTSSGQNFVIPVLPADDWHRFARLAFDDLSLDGTEKFETIDKRYATRNFLFYVCLPLVLITSVLSFQFGWLHMAWATLMLPGWFLCRLARQRWGVWQDGNYAVIRQGLFGVDYTVFPIFKMQHAFDVQTPMQGRKGLKDLGVQLAFKQLRVPWLASGDVEAFINQSLASVETSTRKWI